MGYPIKFLRESSNLGMTCSRLKNSLGQSYFRVTLKQKNDAVVVHNIGTPFGSVITTADVYTHRGLLCLHNEVPRQNAIMLETARRLVSKLDECSIAIQIFYRAFTI